MRVNMRGMAAAAMMAAKATTGANAQADIGVCHVQDIQSASFSHLMVSAEGGTVGFERSNGERFEIDLSDLENGVVGNGFMPSATRMSDIGNALQIINADMFIVDSNILDAMGDDPVLASIIDDRWQQVGEIAAELFNDGYEGEARTVLNAANSIANIARTVVSNCNNYTLDSRAGPTGMQ